MKDKPPLGNDIFEHYKKKGRKIEHHTAVIAPMSSLAFQPSLGYRNTVRHLAAYILIILCLGLPARAMARATPKTCTYKAATWNVKLKRSVDIHTVSHPYSALLPGERDPESGCTVCREDQVPVSVPGVGQTYLCYKFAKRVEAVLRRLAAQGVHIVSLRGYKVIKSRGPLDARGNRTGFSNHSYGAALDINRELNGLYKNCIHWGPDCKLALGGPWRPGVPGTLVKGGPVVSAMEAIGFKWGGEIAGREKDFMHFSPTGY